MYQCEELSMSHIDQLSYYNGATATILNSKKDNRITKTIEKKSKRVRTAFTTEQINALEEEFKVYQYVDKIKRDRLIKKLGLSDRNIKIWFQNRRMKRKKDETEEKTDISDAAEDITPPQTPEDNLIVRLLKTKSKYNFAAFENKKANEVVNQDYQNIDKHTYQQNFESYLQQDYTNYHNSYQQDCYQQPIYLENNGFQEYNGQCDYVYQNHWTNQHVSDHFNFDQQLTQEENDAADNLISDIQDIIKNDIASTSRSDTNDQTSFYSDISNVSGTSGDYYNYYSNSSNMEQSFYCDL